MDGPVSPPASLASFMQDGQGIPDLKPAHAGSGSDHAEWVNGLVVVGVCSPYGAGYTAHVLPFSSAWACSVQAWAGKSN